MAMERFHPADLSPRRNHPDATATTLPNSWPIDYEDLLPYYTAAEQLYRVKGTIDPLRIQETSGLLGPPPTPLHPANQELYDFFLAKGLHPYRLPMACEYLPDCQDCQGYLCARACKNDSTRICLEPAVRQYGARLLDQCDIIKLEATGDRVSGVICNWRGSLHTLRAKTVILAAGALQTPRILLNSISDAWPQGLANDSGLVGRNLMRHCIDLYAIFPRARDQLGGNLKQLGFNDLYQPPDQHLGTVQSFGRLPPAAVMVEQLEQELREGPWPTAARLFKPLKGLLRPALGGLFSRSIILATILEDMPCRDNRVMPGDRGLILNYRLHPYDRSRIRHFRQTMRGILKPYRHLLLKQAENNQRIAHACGTCRFGTDPRESVLAPTNRAHALANLYVVDSSFFPSSGATNPSLTIAANALRVADHLSS
jgi:choline dehydrogenase-like flavoprotein